MRTGSADVVEELLESLEICSKRLREIRSEVDAAAGLVNLALANAGHLRSSSSDEARIAGLLEKQRKEIVGEVRRLLAGTEPTASGPHLFSINSGERIARVGRRRIPLTATEFRLLEHLWARRPRSVSRAELLDHLYPDGDRPGDAVIDMFIFKIRQKLRNAGCSDASIDVVRGEGWLLNVDLSREAMALAGEGEAAGE